MSYLTQHFKGKYRIVPELSPYTHDVPREEDGSVDKSFDDLYIKCSYGNKIYYYGHGTFVAYIPSKIRGNNIVKELDKNNILFYDLHIYDSEVEFKFKAADMDTVADLLKANLVNGTGIIDCDFSNSDNEGHIFIKLVNRGNKEFSVTSNTAVAQGIFLEYGITEDDHVETERNGGFGSTDKKE